MKAVRESCVPRAEVLRGDLGDAIFAADFGHVIEERAPGVYQNPEEFFRNTHPAAPLRKVISTIFGRLADPNEAGAVIRLSTGFGGGKTHTLIALWHLAETISQTLGTELLPAAGRPKDVAVAGVDGDKLGATVCGRHDGLITQSLWGELAFQLGGAEGYTKVESVDSPETAPDSALIRGTLPPDKPVLILLDELVLYMAKLSEQGRRSLLAFVGALTSEIAGRSQSVLVITDPAGQPSYRKEADDLIEATQHVEAARQLEDVLGRKMSDFDPIGNESAQVIIRRLFERVDRSAVQEASAEYFSAYKLTNSEYPDLLPTEAATSEYSDRIVQCYPFHPRLLETARNRLGILQDFQKSRGTLRLFARILRDVWDSGSDVALINAGDLDWTSDRIQADLLQRLSRDNFKPAVDADIVQHAGKLDQDSSTDIHRRVASALLLESLQLTDTAAMDKSELTLAVMRPSDVGSEAGDAIDRLMSVCWHTYKDNSGLKFQFRYQPNVNKLVEERAGRISQEDARQDVLTLAQSYFKGRTFKLVAYPGSPQAVQDSADLKLVLCEDEEGAQAVCDYEDNTNPDAKRPRRFRNAIFGIAPTHAALEDATQEMRRLKAASDIAKEQKSGSLKEQINALLNILRKRAQLRAVRAFNRVVFQGKPSVTLSEKYLVDDTGLGSVNGQTKLKEFLDDNKLVYQPNDALDVDLLTELMNGATPSLDHQGAYPTSAVHERALADRGLRLMLNEDAIRNAILKAVRQGKLVVRLLNGDSYDENGCVTGVKGSRIRIEGSELKTLKLDADVLMALSDAPCVAEWLKIDEGDVEGELLTLEEAASQKQTTIQKIDDAAIAGQIDYVSRDDEKMITVNEKFHGWHPYTSRRASTSTWEEAISYAARRPLMKLDFKANTPDAADSLIVNAQPFGAKFINLSVNASGQAKDGGYVNFAASNLKHNSALKPIDFAKRLLRGADEGAKFEAIMALNFGDDGMENATSRFQQVRDQATDDVSFTAEFGEESEAEGK